MLVVAALIAVPAFWAGRAVVVAGALVPGWLAGGVLLGGVVALRGVARGLSVRRTPAADPPPPSDIGARQTAALWMAGMCTVLALAGQVLFGASFTTLRPTAPGGCVLIAEETSFLVAGSGRVWFAPSGWGVARRVMSYSSDDGGRPFSTDDYSLTWPASSAFLTIHSGAGPVWFHGTSGGTYC